MARIPFALLLVVGLGVTVARAGPVAHPIDGLRASEPAPPAAAAPAPGAQTRCHAREVSLQGDPHSLLLRIAAAALRVVAQVFQLPGWSGTRHDLSGVDDLRAAIDTLWSCLTEASRTVGGSGGN